MKDYYRGSLLLKSACKLALFLCLWGTLPAYADGPCQATYYVNKLSDFDNGRCSPSHCTLREAILAANACPGSHVITLPAGTYRINIPDTNPGAPDDLSRTGDLDIRNTITIRGAGADQTIIDGFHANRIFDVRSNALTLEDMTLSRGATIAFGILSTSGGALRTERNTRTTLNRVKIKQSYANHGYGTAAISNEGQLAILYSEISASTGLGGGALSNGLKGEAQVYFTSIINNTTEGSTISNSGLLGIYGSTLSGNVYTGVSGTMLSSSGSVSITESLIENNRGTGGAISGNSPSADKLSYVTISHSTIRGNTADVGGVGGGLRNHGSTSIYRSLFDNNYAGFWGGSIDVWGPYAYISESIIRNSRTEGSGGAIHVATSGETIINASLIEGNSAAMGGGIYATAGNTRILNTTLQGNVASEVGGAIRTGGGLTGVKNSTITDNDGGGGIAVSVGILTELRVSHTIMSNASGTPECVIEGEADGFAVLRSYGFNKSRNGGCSLNHPKDLPIGEADLAPLSPTTLLAGTSATRQPTLVRIPNPGSPLINAGDSVIDNANRVELLGCMPYDARGVARPVNLSCDIGAVEQ